MTSDVSGTIYLCDVTRSASIFDANLLFNNQLDWIASSGVVVVVAANVVVSMVIENAVGSWSPLRLAHCSKHANGLVD